MDTELNSPPRDGDGDDSAAAFRKPSNDGSGRKYRRRALADDGSSPRDGSPERLDLKHSKEDVRKVSESGYERKDDRRESDRSRYGKGGGRDSHRHERYSRDMDYRSKRDDYNRHERYSRDTDYGSKRDDYSRHERDAPRYSRDSRGGHHSDRRRGETEHSKSRNEKDRVKSPRDRSDGKCVEAENRDSHSKKLKGFSSGKFTKGETIAEEKETSSLKPLPGAENQGLTLQPQSKEAGVSGDVDAAKVAAMQAANLVNQNLVGTGYLTTDQKKKLLWGKKKSTAAEEPAHRWDGALIGDPERQEKFNKLMSLRLRWCIIVGCEREHSKPREESKRSPSREAERVADGSREAVHSGIKEERWTYCRVRSLNLFGRLYSFSCLLLCLKTLAVSPFCILLVLLPVFNHS